LSLSIIVSKNSYKSENGRLPLALGYALTVYASQGTTIDGNVYVYWTSGMDRANSYVAGSRHKDNCHWFFNNKEIDMLTLNNVDQLNSEVSRTDSTSQIMSSDRKKLMALEYIKHDVNLMQREGETFMCHSTIL